MRERCVRSRGLPSHRGMDRKCGIMTKAIRNPLVVSGAGERPAKKLAHQPCVRFLIALPCGEPSPTLPLHTQKKCTQSPTRLEIVRVRVQSRVYGSAG